MWRRRAKQVAVIAVAVFAVSVAGLVWLWRDRPSLDNIDWPAPVIASAAATDTVVVTWLGVTTLLFDDGETQILVDGFFSRPSIFDVVLNRPVENDAPTINYALDEYRMRRLAAIIPVHSHFDHAMDVGAIANRTSASVLGSESTAEIARGAGVPEDQITLVIENQPYEFGRFTVTLKRSRHAPVGWRGTVPLDGTIDEPLTMPQPVGAWREGGSFTIVISHPEGTTVVQGSAGLAGESLRDVPADTVMLGVGALETLGRDYAEQYWQSIVTATGAESVYPIHFDDFTKPFGETVPGPRVLGDLATMTEWLEAFREKWDNDAQLFMPEFGRPIAIYAQPAPEA
jgi:L-ascorbate metabolism protein UlaG (beta-lactamase superfamily)